MNPTMNFPLNGMKRNRLTNLISTEPNSWENWTGTEPNSWVILTVKVLNNFSFWME